MHAICTKGTGPTQMYPEPSRIQVVTTVVGMKRLRKRERKKNAIMT